MCVYRLPSKDGNKSGNVPDKITAFCEDLSRTYLALEDNAYESQSTDPENAEYWRGAAEAFGDAVLIMYDRIDKENGSKENE